MHRGGNGSKLETGYLDRKRIKDALDKHLEKSSPSTSRGMIGKDRDRLTVPSSASGNHPDHRSLTKHKTSDGDMFTEEQHELAESAAEMLYGLIHVRYILTSKGMAAMKNSRIMNLEDALEFTVVGSLVFLLDRRIFLVQALLRFIVPNVTMYTIQDQSTMAILMELTLGQHSLTCF